MDIKKWKHTGVSSDGKVESGGAVGVNGRLTMSRGEGCGLPHCKCSEGFWVCFALPLKDGVVEGTTVHFHDLEEMDKFVNLGADE